MSYAPPPPGPPPPPGGYGQPPGYGPPQGFYYGPPMPPGAMVPHASRGGNTALIAVFVGALVGVAVLVGIIVLANQPPPPPPCSDVVMCPPPPQPTFLPKPSQSPVNTLPPLPTPAATVAGATPAPTPVGATPGPVGTPVPTPESNSPPYVGGTVWSSATLGYSFEYDPSTWTLSQTDTAYAQLLLGPVELAVIGYPSSTSVDAALQDVYNQTDNFIIGRSENTSSYDALLGPEIGFVSGSGGVFSGTWKNADGTPGDPAGITVMAATHDKATVVVVVLVHNPDNAFGSGTLQHAARKTADDIIKTFVWGTGQ